MTPDVRSLVQSSDTPLVSWRRARWSASEQNRGYFIHGIESWNCDASDPVFLRLARQEDASFLHQLISHKDHSHRLISHTAHVLIQADFPHKPVSLLIPGSCANHLITITIELKGDEHDWNGQIRITTISILMPRLTFSQFDSANLKFSKFVQMCVPSTVKKRVCACKWLLMKCDATVSTGGRQPVRWRALGDEARKLPLRG